MIIKQSTIEGAGDGVFATENISSGTTICEYEGLKCKFSEDTTDKSRTYVIDPDNVIIGTGIGVMINDSVEFRPLTYNETVKFFTEKSLPHSRPHNCKFVVEGGQVLIVAIRDIKKDDELFIDYGFGFWAIRILRKGYHDRSYNISHFAF